MAQFLTTTVQDHLLLMLLILTRLGVMMLGTPALGAGVPMRVRALIAIALTILIAPLTENANTSSIHNLVDLAVALAREAFIGLLIGTVIQLLITGLQTVGELASSSGGLQLGDTYDQQARTNMPVLSKLIGMLAMAVLLMMGGHREMLDALLGSFNAMPPGRVELDEGILDLVIHELSTGLAAGIRAAAPMLAAVLLSNLVTGLVSRTLPQLNLLAIGLNINTLAIMVVAFLSISLVGTVFEQEAALVFDRLQDFFRNHVLIQHG